MYTPFWASYNSEGWQRARAWEEILDFERTVFRFLLQKSFWGYTRFGSLLTFFFDLLKKNILFIYSWEAERGGDTGRGRSRLPAGSLMWDFIRGPWDHYALSQRQTLNHWATQVPQPSLICMRLIFLSLWQLTYLDAWKPKRFWENKI